jgi:hypothetical protein
MTEKSSTEFETMAKERGRAFKAGAELNYFDLLDEARRKNKKEILEKASALLHQQANKEQTIAPNLRNYIRSVVIGAQQINNITNNPQLLGDASRLEYADIELWIDAVDNKIYMKKEGFDAIEFDLTTRMIKTHGVDFGGLNGQIVGVTDNPWWEEPRSNFIVSEKGLVPLYVNMADVREKLDTIIQMLGDVETMLENFETNVNSEFDEVDAEISALSSIVGAGFEAVGARFDTVGVELEDLETHVDAQFVNVADDIGELDTKFSGRFDNVDSEIAALGSSLGGQITTVDGKLDTLTTNTAASVQNIRADIAALALNQSSNFTAVNEQLEDMKSQLNTIQTEVEEILSRL